MESEHSDVMEYTKEWINKVNRGGLFPLNDVTYQFFIVIEIEVQILLPQYVTRVRKSDCGNFQVKVIDQVCGHDDVQWYIIIYITHLPVLCLRIMLSNFYGRLLHYL